MQATLLIKNARQLINPISVPIGFGDIQIIEHGAIACFQDKIIAVDTTDELQKKIELTSQTVIIDASQHVVAPGFVDAHTHPVFYGTREQEFILRIKGKSYQEISKAGGGIRATVRNLRQASIEQLVEQAIPHLDNFLKCGTTTIEAKSGYGLTLADELKSLRVIKKLNEMHAIDLVPTFLGAHEIPEEYQNRREEYIRLIIDEMIPRVAEEKLAEFCDIFCEAHVFNLEESREILNAAKAHGLKIKIHADQLTATGASELAAELGAISADHLDYISPAAMEQLKTHGVIPVILPGSVFFLGLQQYAPARRMIDMGIPVALATNFNPGSCMSESLPMMLTIACIYMKLLPQEAWIAATINAARAINRAKSIGNLAAGKNADIVLWNIPNLDYLPYHFGINRVHKVIKNGKIVVG